MNAISLDGTSLDEQLIGGPTHFITWLALTHNTISLIEG